VGHPGVEPFPEHVGGCLQEHVQDLLARVVLPAPNPPLIQIITGTS
jgi:hypothetical protein